MAFPSVVCPQRKASTVPWIKFNVIGYLGKQAPCRGLFHNGRPHPDVPVICCDFRWGAILGPSCPNRPFPASVTKPHSARPPGQAKGQGRIRPCPWSKSDVPFPLPVRLEAVRAFSRLKRRARGCSVPGSSCIPPCRYPAGPARVRLPDCFRKSLQRQRISTGNSAAENRQCPWRVFPHADRET